MNKNLKPVPNKHFTCWRNIVRSVSTFGQIVHVEKQIPDDSGEVRTYECIVFNYVDIPLQCVYHKDDDFIRLALVKFVDEPANIHEREILASACDTLFVRAIQPLWNDKERVGKIVSISEDVHDATRLVATMIVYNKE